MSAPGLAPDQFTAALLAGTRRGRGLSGGGSSMPNRLLKKLPPPLPPLLLGALPPLVATPEKAR
jgi:hypothetical protein